MVNKTLQMLKRREVKALWALCEKAGIEYFSQANRKEWKTKITKGPYTDAYGILCFHAEDNIAGLLITQIHMLERTESGLIHHRAVLKGKVA